MGRARGAWLLPLLLACGFAAAQEALLEVKVGAAAPRRLGQAELAALPQTEIVEARSVGAGGKAENAEVRWRGVLLRDLLDAAGMQSIDRYALRHSGVVARATDKTPCCSPGANCITPRPARTCWSSPR